jgi:hypothetical protein
MHPWFLEGALIGVCGTGQVSGTNNRASRTSWTISMFRQYCAWNQNDSQIVRNISHSVKTGDNTCTNLTRIMCCNCSQQAGWFGILDKILYNLSKTSSQQNDTVASTAWCFPIRFDLSIGKCSSKTLRLQSQHIGTLANQISSIIIFFISISDWQLVPA